MPNARKRENLSTVAEEKPIEEIGLLHECNYDECEKPCSSVYPAKRSEVEVLGAAAHYLRIHDKIQASKVIRNEYPFKRPEHNGHNYTMQEMLVMFIEDGFIDRYSGEKLIHPGMLRAFSVLLEDGVFPYDSHWKTTACHPAYWTYQPSVDHEMPVSLSGEDDRKNWVTTSFIRNQAKGNATLEQLGWTKHNPGNFKDWDGLTHDFLAIYEAYPELHKIQRIRQWYQATVKVMHDLHLD